MKPLLDESPSLLSPVGDVRLLKSEQYSALFETACEIEYYTSHKNLPESRHASYRRKPRPRREGSGKSVSATSSPVHYSDSLPTSPPTRPPNGPTSSPNINSKVVGKDRSSPRVDRKRSEKEAVSPNVDRHLSEKNFSSSAVGHNGRNVASPDNECLCADECNDLSSRKLENLSNSQCDVWEPSASEPLCSKPVQAPDPSHAIETTC